MPRGPSIEDAYRRFAGEVNREPTQVGREGVHERWRRADPERYRTLIAMAGTARTMRCVQYGSIHRPVDPERTPSRGRVRPRRPTPSVGPQESEPGRRPRRPMPCVGPPPERRGPFWPCQPDADPSDRLEAALLARSLRAAIDRLPDAPRAALLAELGHPHHPHTCHEPRPPRPHTRRLVRAALRRLAADPRLARPADGLTQAQTALLRDALASQPHPPRPTPTRPRLPAGPGSRAGA